ncbi:gem (nuclear organelle) associated protein 7 [Leptinotarsa decemlineata]|uniref:gem (nuclear organelle) associated protein 7 n=1 Tax=Leptinotarsa decemlineata TaxID=7539 RepID=UPI003D3091A5
MLNEEEKKANAFLRERFLNLLSSACDTNKRCEINMHENTQVSGVLKAVDVKFQNIIVEDLKTPLPETIKMATLRTSDVLTISFSEKMTSSP